jgi:hypothetical protein
VEASVVIISYSGCVVQKRSRQLGLSGGAFVFQSYNRPNVLIMLNFCSLSSDIYVYVQNIQGLIYSTALAALAWI